MTGVQSACDVALVVLICIPSPNVLSIDKAQDSLELKNKNKTPYL